jgi:hypothetical protein
VASHTVGFEPTTFSVNEKEMHPKPLVKERKREGSEPAGFSIAPKREKEAGSSPPPKNRRIDERKVSERKLISL